MLNFNHKNSRMQQAWMMKPDPRFFFPERGAVGLLGIIMPEGGGGGYLSIFTFLCEF